MSKENLKLYIKSRTDEEVKKIISEAENATKKIIEEAESKAARIKDEKLRKTKKEMDEKEKAEMSLTKMDGRKKVMDVKEEFLKTTFEEVKKRLKSFSSKTNEKYQDILTTLAIEAISNTYSEEVIISANKNDLDVLRKNIQAIRGTVSKMKSSEVDIELDDKAINTIGGVIAYSKDGKRIYNNTLEAKLSRASEESKGKILTMLFGE